MLHSFEDVTVDAEKFETLGRCFALMVFKQRGILIVPHLLSHGTIVLEVISEGTLFISSYFYKQGVLDAFTYPGLYGS